MNSLRRISLFVALSAAPMALANAAGLSGSPSSMLHQHGVAVREDYSFLRTPSDVQHLVDLGGLVELTSGANHDLIGVSFPYARPAVKSFVEHFAAEYHDSTGGRLVVTSLTRPGALQPRNAHRLSVHPAGMAVDFRVPSNPTERAFLERALLKMERDGVLDATRERTPAHYHVAVFPEQYEVYAARQDSAAAANKPLPRASLTLGSGAEALVAVTDSPPASPLMRMLLAMSALLGVAVPAVRQPRRARVRSSTT